MVDAFLMWLVENAAQLTNAGNGAWICISAMVAFYMFRLNRSTTIDMVRSLSGGIFLVAGSSMIHRLWWFLGILFAPAGLTYAKWATDYRGILILFVLTLCIGYSMHIKLALEKKCGRFWWLRPAAAVTFGTVLGWYETNAIIKSLVA